MSFLRKLQYPVILRMLDPLPNESILDIGCGNGELVCEIAKKAKCLGVDLVGGRRKNIASTKNAGFQIADAEGLPFEDGSFDKVILSSVLQMVNNDKNVLRESRRVLKHNGTMILSIPLDYLIIRRLYMLKGAIFGRIRRLLRLPLTYEGLKKQFIVKFGSKGKGYYAFDEIKALLNQTGFIISDVEYSPKRWGTIIYETMLIFCNRFRLPLYHRFYDRLMFPLVYFDRFLSKRSPGCEIVIRALAQKN